MLSTDVAPTILERLGIEVPSQMSGQPIRAEGAVDPAAIESLGERMAVISERRGPVIGLEPAGSGSWPWRWRSRCSARGAAGADRRCGSSGLAVVYLPLVLLLGAALEPGRDGGTCCW